VQNARKEAVSVNISLLSLSLSLSLSLCLVGSNADSGQQSRGFLSWIDFAPISHGIVNLRGYVPTAPAIVISVVIIPVAQSGMYFRASRDDAVAADAKQQRPAPRRVPGESSMTGTEKEHRHLTRDMHVR